LKGLAGNHVGLLSQEELIVGHQGCRSWPHIGEDQSTGLHARIGRMPNPFMEGAAGRLAGLLEAAPLNVVEPPVVDAAEAAVLDASNGARGAPVGLAGPERARDPRPATAQAGALRRMAASSPAQPAASSAA